MAEVTIRSDFRMECSNGQEIYVEQACQALEINSLLQLLYTRPQGKHI